MLKQLRHFSCALVLGCFSASHAHAVVINFNNSDFALTTTLGNVTSFEILIDLAGFLTPGTSYSNPALNRVAYLVEGAPDANSPSGFPMFRLQQDLSGSELYDLGGSLNFTVLSGADLSDGLQVSDLTSSGFVFDALQTDSGRFHPPLVTLLTDGSGIICDSLFDCGEEYITELSFEPESLTLSPSPVPIPPALYLFSAGAIGLPVIAKRKKSWPIRNSLNRQSSMPG